MDYCVLEVYYCPWLYCYTLLLLCKEHNMESLKQILSSCFNLGSFWFVFFFQIRNNKKTAILVKEVNPKKKLFLIYRPNTGKQLKLETCADLKKKYKKVTIKIMLVFNLEKFEKDYKGFLLLVFTYHFSKSKTRLLSPEQSFYLGLFKQVYMILAFLYLFLNFFLNISYLWYGNKK